MFRVIFAILTLTFAVGFAETSRKAAIDEKYCNGQISRDSWGEYYPNGQKLRDSWGAYYPNGEKLKDSWGSYYINKQKQRDSWGTYYPNGKIIKDSWGIYYPNGQKIRDSWGCYNSDGSEMMCRDVMTVRIQVTPEILMKLQLDTRTGNVLRLSHEIDDSPGVTTIVDTDVEAGQILFVDALCGGPFNQ